MLCLADTPGGRYWEQKFSGKLEGVVSGVIPQPLSYRKANWNIPENWNAAGGSPFSFSLRNCI